MIRTKIGYKFESTGLEVYSNDGIIGINQNKEIFQGYDGLLEKQIDFEDVEFSEEEKRELSKYMIALWTDFGNKIN